MTEKTFENEFGRYTLKITDDNKFKYIVNSEYMSMNEEVSDCVIYSEETDFYYVLGMPSELKDITNKFIHASGLTDGPVSFRRVDDYVIYTLEKYEPLEWLLTAYDCFTEPEGHTFATKHINVFQEGDNTVNTKNPTFYFARKYDTAVRAKEIIRTLNNPFSKEIYDKYNVVFDIKFSEEGLNILNVPVGRVTSIRKNDITIGRNMRYTADLFEKLEANYDCFDYSHSENFNNILHEILEKYTSFYKL